MLSLCWIINIFTTRVKSKPVEQDVSQTVILPLTKKVTTICQFLTYRHIDPFLWRLCWIFYSQSEARPGQPNLFRLYSDIYESICKKLSRNLGLKVTEIFYLNLPPQIFFLFNVSFPFAWMCQQQIFVKSIFSFLPFVTLPMIKMMMIAHLRKLTIPIFSNNNNKRFPDFNVCKNKLRNLSLCKKELHQIYVIKTCV